MTTPVIFQGTLPVEDGGVIDHYSLGIPLTTENRVCIALDGVQSYAHNGVPFDSNGRVVVVDNGDDSRVNILGTSFLLRSDGDVVGFNRGLPYSLPGGSVGPSFPEWTAQGAVAAGDTIAQVAGTVGEVVQETRSAPQTVGTVQVTTPHPTIMSSAVNEDDGIYFTCWVNPGLNTQLRYGYFKLTENGAGVERIGGDGIYNAGREIKAIDCCYSTVSGRYYVGLCVADASTNDEDIRAIQITLTNPATGSSSVNVLTVDTTATSKDHVKVVSVDSKGYVAIYWNDFGNDAIYGETNPVTSSGWGTFGNKQTYASAQITELLDVAYDGVNYFLLAYRQVASTAGVYFVTFLQGSNSSSVSAGSPARLISNQNSYGYNLAPLPGAYWGFSHRNSSGSLTTSIILRASLGLSVARNVTFSVDARFKTVNGFYATDASDAGKYYIVYANNDDTDDLYVLSYDYVTGGTPNLTNAANQEIDPTANVQYMAAALDNTNKMLWTFYEEITAADVIAYAFDGILESNAEDFVGIAQSAANDGETFLLANSGLVAEGLTGLTPAATYYVEGDGTLTTTDTGVVAGDAQSATTLLVA